MACSDEIPPCSSTLGGDAIKAQLQAMFPNTSQATINNTVDQALDLSEAIDQPEEDVSLILYQAGFGNQTLTISNKDEAIQCILFHQVIKSRRDQIADLVHGLDTMNILELIRMNNACLSVVFPLTSEVAISESDFIGRLEHAQGLQANEKEVITWFEQHVKSLSVGR